MSVSAYRGAPATTPHFALPFRVTSAGADTVEQGSLDEIIASVYGALAYQQGQRIERPDFGLPEQAFLQGGADLDEIRATIARWEPRADALTDEELRGVVVDVSVRVRATGSEGG